jgi:aspartyl-tRNA(Asn)/glutamyl-tRNA(Gln) amidotransferase subunit A
MGLGSIGTDTGGSIRIPAAACGVVGLKPSLGEIPTDGVIPLSRTTDHVGPLGRTVQDVAWLWAAMADQPLPSLKLRDAATLRLGRLRGYFSLLADEVSSAFSDGLSGLQRHGATIIERSVDGAATSLPVYVNLVLPEAAAWHAKWLDSRTSDYTPDVWARFTSGRTISAVDYLAARAARHALTAAVDAALVDVDALVLPTMPIVAPFIGPTEVTIAGDRLPIRAAMLRHTQLFNMTGHPAISLPMRASGLPVGLQLVGRRGETERLLAVAALVERLVSPAA